MSVYKEGFSWIQEISSKQKQIYPDAADFGAPTKKGDSVWETMKDLTDWYGNKETKKVDVYATGTTVTIHVELLDEWDSGAPVNFELVYVTTRRDKNQDGYVYVRALTPIPSFIRRKYGL